MNTNTKWFTDAKYGLFVHWGLYSILGGEWNGKRVYYNAEWIMKRLEIPVSEYKQLAKAFNPTKFDAREYVKLAKKWGMKYIVVTAKHHDGFALYDSKVSDYTVMNSPYGKDIIREFADACAEEDIVFCVYYSQMQDWEHPDGNGNTWDFDPEKKDFENYFYNKVVPQVKELLTNYGRIGLIWFDTPYNMPKPLCEELREVVKSCQPDCLINGRIGYGLGDYRQMADNSIPHNTYNKPWEVPMTINSTWGYSKFDTAWTDEQKIVERLSSIAGKGGNLVLNVGPDPDGVIPQESVRILDRVGEWLDINGDSIYNTTVLPDFPYEIPWGNITYRTDLGKLYFHIKNYPSNTKRILLAGLKNKVKSVSFLKNREALDFNQDYEQARDEERFRIMLPEECPDPIDTVAVVEIEGTPDVQKLV